MVAVLAKNHGWYEATRKQRLADCPMKSELLTDWLMVRRNAVADAAKVVEFCKTLPFTRTVPDDARSCETVELRTVMDTPGVADLDAGLYLAFSEVMRDLMSDNPFVNVKRDEGYTVMRYGPGDSCGMHSDTWQDLQVTQRVVSGIITLNSDYEGGELVFPRQGVLVRPETGMVILFPSSHAFPHQVLPVISGHRYAIVTWMGAK